MALICLEGVDRSGKSTVADWYSKQGFEVVHLSAPDKKYTQPGYSGPSYFEDYVDILMSFNNKDVVFDRSWLGEILWPQIYGRLSLLSEEDVQSIIEIENSIGVERILMHDPDREAHWKRCVDNNEPLNRSQFLKARVLYERLAKHYGFEKKCLEDFSQFKERQAQKLATAAMEETAVTNIVESGTVRSVKTKEQLKLEKANAINDILSKRIIKGKGDTFDLIEQEIRSFLNTKLGTIFGNDSVENFSNDDVFILKAFIKRLKEKEKELK